MGGEAVSGSLDNRELASRAIRNRYWQAANFAAIAPFTAVLHDNWPALIGVFLVWLGIGWLLERWRYGPNSKAIRKAEWEFAKSFSSGPYFFGYAWTLVAYLFLDGARDGGSGIDVGTAIILGLAVGSLCQALWLSHKLRGVDPA